MINRYLKNKPTYKSTEAIIMHLKKIYPFINISVIGKTILERNIYSISIGNLNNPVVFTATTHAQEWLTTLLMIKFLNELCKLYKNNDKFDNKINIKNEFDNCGLIVIPLVNPDGLEIAIKGSDSAKHLKPFIDQIIKNSDKLWQSNANGVDINHNFNAGFDKLRKMEIENGIVAPSASQFGGYYPNSENETKALTNLCFNFNVKRLVTFHSQGEEIFYKYCENTPYSSFILAKIFSDLSNYKLVENTAMASHGGFKDWFINKFSKPGFTIEIGKGKNPLPIQDLNKIYNDLVYMMVISIIL